MPKVREFHIHENIYFSQLLYAIVYVFISNHLNEKAQTKNKAPKRKKRERHTNTLNKTSIKIIRPNIHFSFHDFGFASMQSAKNPERKRAS